MDCEQHQVVPLTVRRVAEIEPQPPGTTWLVEDLWLHNGVGLLGGQAKVCKTYLAAELALAVATGQPALGRFQTRCPGPVLFFGAEDSPQALRGRFEGLALARGCDLQKLPVHLIDVPMLRLDRDEDLQRLCAAIVLCKPRLLVLDPFVRLIGRTDENSAADVSAVLGDLRNIQRNYQIAILLVHHARKSPTSNPMQAFRGSSDFAAWSDSNLFLVRKSKLLSLSVENRSARSPETISLRLEHQPAPHLVCTAGQTDENHHSDITPIANEVLNQLENAGRPMTTVELRERLHRRKCNVVTAIELLQAKKILRRTNNGWQLNGQQ